MDKSFECLWPSALPMPPLVRERSERRDASEHRRRILEVAQHLFAAHGVDAVSMHQIAKAAGVGQGTLYRRYAHKGELCMDLLRARHTHFAQELATMLATKATSPALERLDGVLTHISALLEEQETLLGPVAAPDMHSPHCEHTGSLQYFAYPDMPWHQWLYDILMSLLAEAVNRHELATSLDIPYTADALLATLHPMLYRFQRHERGFSAERILQGLRHIYIDGLNGSLKKGI
jgi:AcrR family transcriptional regulator